MPFSKRKRSKRDLRGVSFPLDVQETFSRRTLRTCEPSKAKKSWERCGESFGDTSVIKKLQTAGKKSRALQVLGHSSTPVKCGPEERDFVHITWSSSEEQSDGEDQFPLPFSTTKAPERCKPCPQSTSSYYSRYLRLLSAGADTDDLPTIDSESEHEEHENSTSKDEFPMLVNEISDSSTSDCEGASEQSSRLDVSAVEPTAHRQRSVSEWVRSAQALLQTPQKKTDKTSKTPEDSGKKRRRFECGGLAERLNKLQCRQRSAVSFWKHQSVSNLTTATDERPGILVLHVQSVREVCGMQAALCERATERQPCIALFNKDTATHLAPTVGDTLCVYPPWQSLIVDGEQHPVILNTHFSQKVLSDVKMDGSVICSKVRPLEEKTRPCPLIKCLCPSEKIVKKLSTDKQECALASRDVGDVYESLLEVVEVSGPSGSLSGLVQVMVQRVYLVPVRHSTTSSLRHKTANKTFPRPTQEQHMGRLSMLVQDVYGMFSELELQHVSSEEELKHYIKLLEGKVCVLQGLKVIQRLTRERCTQLFSLIDSFWPPSVPPKVHGESSCCQIGKITAPSFCYRLAGQQGCVLPQDASPLYSPPVIHTLQEILQDEPKSGRCSFKATVVYKREQSAGEDILLFVTDSSLQCPISNSRTLPVYVSPCCLLQPSISQVIASPHLRPALIFKDAVIQNGQIFCWGQCVIQLDSGADQLEQIQDQNLSVPQPILLDQLSSESEPCSLCTLTGVVVDVDEQSAFSWPVCSHCGSDSLETVQNKQEAFLCFTCGAVDKPTQKMQLEVFLSCPSLSECTVKVKLLQKSIVTLLNSTGCDKGYEVESVLGKEVGPLTAFIHIISRRSTLWMSLEEIIL